MSTHLTTVGHLIFNMGLHHVLYQIGLSCKVAVTNLTHVVIASLEMFSILVTLYLGLTVKIFVAILTL